jgi:hypothetical protein
VEPYTAGGAAEAPSRVRPPGALSHLVSPVALYGRPRRTGPLARVAPAPSQTPVACHATHGLLLEIEYREQSRPAGQCPVHAFGRSVVVRLHTCIATSCFFPLLSLLLHFCPLLLLCFFFSLFFIQVTFLFFFFPPRPPCRVKLDVGSCTYVDGILFQQVC